MGYQTNIGYPTNREVIRDLMDTSNNSFEHGYDVGKIDGVNSGKADGVCWLANKLQIAINRERDNLKSIDPDYRSGYLSALSDIEGRMRWIICGGEEGDV